MLLSAFVYAITSLSMMAAATPIEGRNETSLFQLTILAPCVTDCIAEGMDKLVVTQADPITGEKTNTTINDFHTASDDKARKYRPVAVMEFKEVSAQARQLWVNHEDSGLHAAVSRHSPRYSSCR
jgi:hypothetical protein